MLGEVVIEKSAMMPEVGVRVRSGAGRAARSSTARTDANMALLCMQFIMMKTEHHAIHARDGKLCIFRSVS